MLFINNTYCWSNRGSDLIVSNRTGPQARMCEYFNFCPIRNHKTLAKLISRQWWK